MEARIKRGNKANTNDRAPDRVVPISDTAGLRSMFAGFAARAGKAKGEKKGR